MPVSARSATARRRSREIRLLRNSGAATLPVHRLRELELAEYSEGPVPRRARQFVHNGELTTLALLYLLGALAEAPASARFEMRETANTMASAAALVTSPLDIGFSLGLRHTHDVLRKNAPNSLDTQGLTTDRSRDNLIRRPQARWASVAKPPRTKDIFSDDQTISVEMVALDITCLCVSNKRAFQANHGEAGPEKYRSRCLTYRWRGARC